MLGDGVMEASAAGHQGGGSGWQKGRFGLTLAGMAQAEPRLEAYRRTAVFDEGSIPAGLLRRHATKRGVWGRICVLEGELVFRRLEGVTEERRIPAGADVLVAPEEVHEVQACGPVRFFVEFLRSAEEAG